MYPGYARQVADFQENDPLAETRRAIDLARLSARKIRSAATLFVLHDGGGGTARVVQERVAALARAGSQGLILRPHSEGCRLEIPDRDYSNLVFRLPSEEGLLLSALRTLKVGGVEWHHLSGHAPAIRGLHERLGVPVDIFIHDYAWFCQRISLLGPSRRYCGEPDLAGCVTCIARQGSLVDEFLSVAEHRARASRELMSARQVIAPSDDTARRMARHFPGITFRVSPHEDDALFSVAPAIRLSSAPLKIGIIGAIGPEKGYDILLALGLDAAARSLPLDFIVIGHTQDDDALFETGKIRVTGAYREEDLPGLIASCGIDIGFIPSIWPETWCFALGGLWRSGVRSVVFDIGAQAERTRRTGYGWVVPLGIQGSVLNDLFLRLGGRMINGS